MVYLAARLVRLLVWLGLLDQDEPKRLSALYSVRLRKTPLFDRYIHLKVPVALSIRLHRLTAI